MQKDVNCNDICAEHQENIAVKGVDQMQHGHDLIDCDLCCNAGNQRCDHEQIADQMVATELKTVQHICQHCGDHGAAYQHAYQNEKAVEKCSAHVCLYPGDLEVFKVQPAFRQCHDAGRAVLFIGLECGSHAADNGNQRTECAEQKDGILQDLLWQSFQKNAFAFHFLALLFPTRTPEFIFFSASF